METVTPFTTLQSTALAYALARCLQVVADFGLADRLDNRPTATADLAAAADVDPGALARVLRVLAAEGIFALEGEMVCHSPASRLLRSDHPHSLRALVRLFGTPIMWAAYDEFGEAVRTGRPATATILPDGLFAYYATHPDEAALFDQAMTAKAHAHVAGIVATYDFAPFQVIGDIGGGRGHLLRAVLDATPAARGVLFDLPHVIEEAAGLASDRVVLQPGDFFRDRLPACDAYLLMEVLHDWDDADAIRILEAIRRAAPPRATLLIIEQMIPADPGPAWAKLLDIHMLALLGGRQRTRQEYVALLERTGFSFRREIPVPGDLALLEASVA